ncbi:MAG: hypothetical protein WCB85_04985, partial [Candidatus Dormiibacterota bacterium]
MTEAPAAAGVVSRETLEARLAVSPGWLADRRVAAWDAFTALPKPATARDEDWRRTDIAKLRIEEFFAAAAASGETLALARSRHARALPQAALVIADPGGSTMV